MTPAKINSRSIQEITKENFIWMDVVGPTPADLEDLVRRFQLHPVSVQDCLDPEHLPKFEKMENADFLIVRSYDLESDFRASTVQALTRKLAIFFSDRFLLTIRRTHQPYVERIFEKWKTLTQLPSFPTQRITAELLLETANTYIRPVDDATIKFEAYEDIVFHNEKKVRLHQIYLLKRRVAIMKCMLWRLLEPVREIADESKKELRPHFQNTEESIGKLTFQLAETDENIKSLLSLQVSLSSQKTNEASHKTNEVMRVLTIFSVFFMPLNLIAGIYGMNFLFMPELQWHYGYFLALGGMFAVSLGIFLWFKKRGWLKT